MNNKEKCKIAINDSINCSILLGTKNKYRKHSQTVEAFRGIKLKDYALEDTTDLEELNEVLNGSK